MASLDKSAVTPYPTGDIALSEWPSAGKDNRGTYKRRVKVALTGQGSAANSIPAAAFGFAKLLSCTPLVDITNSKVVAAAVDPTRNIVLLADATGAPADVTSAASYITVEGIVTGYSP
jgi:hypothetical protein